MTISLVRMSQFKFSDSDISEDSDKELIEEIIYPGLVLKDDYVLLVKIGCGNNAGVWMIYQISTKSYRAMKIQDFECYEDGCREVRIIKRINEFAKHNKQVDTCCIQMLDFFIFSESPKVQFVCTVYELYAGSIQMLLSNGKYKYGLPISVVRKMAKQLLTAVSFLHSRVDIIHTDIKPENILFRGAPASHQKMTEVFEESSFQAKYDKLKTKYASRQDKFKQELDHLALESVSGLKFIDEVFEINSEEDSSDYDSSNSFIEGEDDFGSDSDLSDDGESSTSDTVPNTESESESESDEKKEEEINTRRQSVPDVMSFVYYKEIIDIDSMYDFKSILNNRENSTDKESVIDDTYVNNCKITVTDFGNSYFYKKRTEHEIQDRIYRAPEVILNFRYGYVADVWSVACVIFELLTGFPLFNVLSEPLTKDIHHLFLMEKILGPMPIVMKKRTTRVKFLFDHRKKYHIKNIPEIKRTNLFEILTKQHLFSEKTAKEISEFLSTALQYNPTKRITATKMLQHKWLNTTN